MPMRQNFPFLDSPGPVAFAHRGGSREAEENTLPAFENAVGLGYGHVELDVHLTRDGAVVVHHDASLARIFGVDRAVADLTLADLRTIHSPAGAIVPQLAEVLHAFPGLRINIEAKADAVVEPLAEVITRAGALARIGVGSFSAARTRALRQALGPDLCWSPSHGGVARLLAAGWGLPLPTGFPVVQIPRRWRGLDLVTPRLIRAAHARGIKVQVWTVDAEAEMEHLLDIGVDGLMTDRPGLLKTVLQRRGQWHPG